MGLASSVALTEGSGTIGRWDLVESPCSLSFLSEITLRWQSLGLLSSF